MRHMLNKILQSTIFIIKNHYYFYISSSCDVTSVTYLKATPELTGEYGLKLYTFN